MESTSKVLASVGSEVIRNDPVRVLRWTVALFFPVLTAIITRIRSLCHLLISTRHTNLGADFERRNWIERQFRRTLIQGISKIYDGNSNNPLLGNSGSAGNLLWL
jgi:hypothetical protein